MVQLKTITFVLAAFACATVANARPVSSTSDIEAGQTKPRLISIDFSGPLGPLKRPAGGSSSTGNKVTPGRGPRPRRLMANKELVSDVTARESESLLNIVRSGIGGRPRTSGSRPSTGNTVTPGRAVGRSSNVEARQTQLGDVINSVLNRPLGPRPARDRPSTGTSVTPGRTMRRPRGSTHANEEPFERSIGSDYEVQDLIERGAFGRLGMVLRPIISGHLKASKVFGRDLENLEDLE